MTIGDPNGVGGAKVLVVSLVALAAVLVAAGGAEAGLPFAAKGHTSNYIFENTRVKNLDPFFFQSPFFPALNDHTKVTTIVQRYPVDPRLLGMPRAKGSVRVNHTCIDVRGGDQGLGRGKGRFDVFGNAATVKTIPAARDCLFHRAETTFKGNQQQVAGSSVATTNVVQRLPTNVDADCFDLDTLCLRNGRFKVNLSWRSSAGSGTAVPVATGFDQGLFYFFNQSSDALLVQLLNQCDDNDFFWVFAQAATDVEYTLTVTDTQASTSRVYDNPLGQPAPAITDTQAFATCP